MDKIIFDSADIIATKQDFIDLMDENARLQQEVKDIRTATLDEVKEDIKNLLPKLAEERDNARIGRQGYMEGRITGVFRSLKAIDDLRGSDEPTSI